MSRKKGREGRRDSKHTSWPNEKANEMPRIRTRSIWQTVRINTQNIDSKMVVASTMSCLRGDGVGVAWRWQPQEEGLPPKHTYTLIPPIQTQIELQYTCNYATNINAFPKCPRNQIKKQNTKYIGRMQNSLKSLNADKYQFQGHHRRTKVSPSKLKPIWKKIINNLI